MNLQSITDFRLSSLASVLIIFIFSHHVAAQTDTTISTASWQEDINYLKLQLFEQHKNAFHTTTQSKLNEKFISLHNQVESVNNVQIILELIEIMSSVGDGHTTIRSFDIFTYYPYYLYWFGDDLRIIWTTENYKNILGAKVLSIGDVEIEQVKTKVNELTPKGENEYMLSQWSQLWMRNADVLYYKNISGSKTEVTMELELSDGTRINQQFEVLKNDNKVSNQWKGVYNPLPNFMTNTRDKVWTEWIDKTFIVHFNAYPEKKDMRKISKNIVDQLEAIDENFRLVIDLRLNGGGDYQVGEILIEQLKKVNDKIYASYVITSRRTYSAAMMNAIGFRQKLNAKIIGEPPMQRPNGYSESYSFRLPNSNINASVSIAYYKLQNEENDGILKMDNIILEKFEQLKAGQDNVLNWVLNQQ